MKQVVLRFGPFREILTDGAPELVGKVIEELVVLLQAQQINPVPTPIDRPGLAKDCVATFTSDERQRDWDTWVDYAVYSYNSGRHSTVMLSPNELMMGRRLRAPNELLRATMVTEAGDLVKHHEKLLSSLKEAHECAERA
ncbi:Cyclic AMP-dependent protein kinase [Phytophthora megakarya]|uniref:Cyclic AMP-dependent protein kinase n=1 Tax=Phytophthora megakarya TaxID=4795 RepID=A0A225VTF1_9STRA|nr:Cyclic AMP-dependent protein kinase [Phytophthora megakarya]